MNMCTSFGVRGALDDATTCALVSAAALLVAVAASAVAVYACWLWCRAQQYDTLEDEVAADSTTAAIALEFPPLHANALFHDTEAAIELTTTNLFK
jgi:hypothetical protein